MNRAVSYGGVLYLGGIVADDVDADIESQTRQVLRKVFSLLEAHGSDRLRMLSCTVYLADLGDKSGMDRAWVEAIDAQHLPARATVGAALGGGALIEVVATAALAARA